MEIKRSVLVPRTHLLGVDYEQTLTSAFSLAIALSYCGQWTEAGQLFRGTLAASRRVLGPTHELTGMMGQVRLLNFLRNALSWVSRGLEIFLVGLAYLAAR